MEMMIDIFVIGGGINGTAIAADAAGRGLTVMLCEKGDLASATSSASTKLIHGGLRYLELYEFHLVRKALKEREILLHRAPNLITPLEFILPHEKHLRPAWLIRLGLFLYDHLAHYDSLPHSKVVNLTKDIRGKMLQSTFTKGFSYYDCFTDDSRLVILNALSAKNHGATISTHTEFMSAQRENNLWKIELKNLHSDEIYFCYAKAIVNTAGSWVKEVQKKITGSSSTFEVELVKGSHIIVPKMYEGDFAYILQNADHRIIFAIPYHNDFTLIGTTDIVYTGNPSDAKISDDEIHYLCSVINQHFKKAISPTDIIWSYSGLRCLQANESKNPSEITRDYKLILESENMPPLLNVVGGKLTTHRTLAEDVLNKLHPFFPSMGSPWTANEPLPGADFNNQDCENFYRDFKSKYAWLPDNLSTRYAKNYGTHAYQLLYGCYNMEDLGVEFAADLYQIEIEYLIKNEWAETLEDILWRRTKLGLYFSESATHKLAAWLKNNSTLLFQKN